MLDESRNPQSKWKAFLATQPQDWSNSFTMLSDEDIELLNGSPLNQQAKARRNELEQDWATLKKIAPALTATFSKQEFFSTYLAV